MVNERLQQALTNVQKAAQADKVGAGQAHVDLLDAVRKLNLAAESPAETLMRMRFEPLQSAAIRLALEAGVLEAISVKRGEKVTAEELANITQYDTLLIERIMRLVTWCGVSNEVGEATYAANDATHLIVTPGLSGGEKHHYDLFFPVGARLMDYMKETKVHQFPTPPQKTAFEYAHGMDFWHLFQNSPEQRKYLDEYMATRRKGIQSWFETFPMASELFPDAKQDSDAILLVDVGGGKGHDAAHFHAAHPDHPGKLIVEDLDYMIERVTREGAPDGIEYMTYDFFTVQPIKGARVYYFHNICHDWDDPSCERFLSNTAKAMEPGYSRLLIDDYVLPGTNAPIRGSSMDFLMMLFCGGIERTERQWKAMLEKCGLEIVKVWSARSDYEQVIEAKLKE